MREEFEKLPEICSLINDLSFDDDANEYVAKIQNPFEHDSNECFVNGAWYAYQEQQKKINKALELGYEKRGSVHYLVDEHIDEIQGVLE